MARWNRDLRAGVVEKISIAGSSSPDNRENPPNWFEKKLSWETRSVLGRRLPLYIMIPTQGCQEMILKSSLGECRG
ncbi:hypothetical protein DVH24_002383 [Malus domestica]|uniref:Uncharacterized protein n=1 Tax=Malus domestica TaxID=3750 RepID=A0A498KPK4_MALDO|nr:hypothetical protein DVH24_002383 [Malus domestica]